MTKFLTEQDEQAVSDFFIEWRIDNPDYDFDEEPELKHALQNLGILDKEEDE